MLKMRPGEMTSIKSQALNLKQYQMVKIPMSQRCEFGELEFV
jgi:hypothetical protein